ncbi:MAG: rRNA maturation RNase YbeY [Desulfosudaceae bacterium]
MGSPESELSLVITDDEEIAVLNQRYLNRAGPTNVIAFPMAEGEFTHITPDLLGDVVISAETAAAEAAGMGVNTEERFTQLLVHGILHLFGYDHEQSGEEAAVMEKKSDELLAVLARTPIR